MPLHDHALFESREVIPELVPSELLLPADSRDIHILKAPEHTETTTTPLEVGFCFYELKAGNFVGERQILDNFSEGFPKDWTVEGWLRAKRGNHCGRLMIRALLDPDRYAPLDLALAYREESKFRGYNGSEEIFFTNFAENWGVLEQPRVR